ncbi:MAG TPA: RNA polymerase sigma-70 factor [Chryseolinea sp.]|nr:RNA polymerase sigma-70 factor [Chryseolinea sp.]
MTPIQHSDEELLKRLLNGDRGAFEEIFIRYWYRLFKVAYGRIRSREEAEEIVQDIFASLWKNHNILLVSNLSNYLFSSVRKGVISKIRSKLVHEKYRNYYLQLFPGYSLATDEAVEFDELSTAIENALLQLPPKSQQVFRLNRLQGLSIPEISEMLKMPRRTIEDHLTKSLRKLRIHLKDHILFLLILVRVWL